jgi:hypothetical protein
MGSDRDDILDQKFIDILVESGYLRCGASRAYAEFEMVIDDHESYFRSGDGQLAFAKLVTKHARGPTASKIDYHGPDDLRGHKLSVQLEYREAERILWDRDVADPFRALAAATVRLVRHDLQRSPIRLLFSEPDRRLSTVRGIIYYPGAHPGVDWHTDGCLAQFISIPAHDASLTLLIRPPRGSHGGRRPVMIEGGAAPETVLLLGRQAPRLKRSAVATSHAVAAVSARRAVATHFLWDRGEDLVEGDGEGLMPSGTTTI